MKNPFSLENKTILVTGASSGIGRSIAIACSQMGANVILNGRNKERLDETRSKLSGDGHLIVIGDLSKQADIERIAKEVPELQGWVNGAGVPTISPIKYFTRESLEDVFNVNSISSMLLLAQLLKNRKLKKGSSIVLISAITGVFVGSVGDTAYCASKGAVNGFLKGSALELAPQGIRINSINPGLVPTEILALSNEKAGYKHHQEIMMSKYPMKRLGTPEDIAYGAIYLLSDSASWVTGQALAIDGGYTLN